MKLNLTKFLLAAVFLLTLCATEKASAAVPTLSYTPATNTYTTGTAITTLTPASTGTGTLGSYGTPTSFGSGYSSPQDVTVDPSGNVYVTNLGNSTVREFNSAGTFISTFGTGLNQPYNISFDASGNSYITNYAANSIIKITSGGVQSTFISTGLTNPFGTAEDAAGNVYVANFNGGGSSAAILEYNSSGTLLQTITTGTPTDVAVDSKGNIYALSYSSGTVTKYNSSGVSQGVVISGLSNDFSLTIDASGNIYVADANYNRVGIYSSTGTLINTVTASSPTGVTVDASGNMYVSSQSGGTVQKFTPTGGFFINKQLPAGLVFNSSTGAISGTPTATSPSTVYTITAYNTSGAGTTTETIKVNPPLPVISYATPQTYTQGVAISTLSPTSTGGAVVTYTASSLPAGLSINASTGAITGIPTTISFANYTITATNAAGTGTATINITVNAGPPNISYPTPQTYVVGTAISTLSPTNVGGTIVSYAATTALPSGLNLNTSTGAITGTPTAVTATANYTITATGLIGSATTIINITINPKLPAISYATPQTYTQNVAITTLSPTSTGGAVATYSAASLPAGLSINSSTGAITGTPTTATIATNYTVTATNVTGSATATINIAVIIAAPTSAAVTQCGAGAVLTAADVSSSGGTYNWYSKAAGGVAFQSSTSTTFSAVCTATYYVSYTYAGTESARTSVTATVNPIVSNPFSGAYFSYPFNGNTNDVSSYQNAGSNNGATLTTDRYGASNAAYSFNGSSNYMNDPFLDNNPSIYTVSIWFNTTTTTGGSIIGLESGNYDDRILYMSNSGQVYWGLYPGSVQTINTAASYNDGNWHHAIVTVSSSGSTLYLDGTAQATSTTMTTGNGTNGYWQMGYSLLSAWTNPPTSNYFSGKLDDIAVYHRTLSSAEIAASNDLNQIYSGTATACTALAFNAPTITGATYTWKDPNNNTQTGQSVSFPGAVTGNYTLTVTGGPGGCSSTATITPVVYTSATATFNALASVAVNTNTSISLFSYVASSTYSWNFGGGTSSSGTTGQGPFSVQWSSTGVKTITLTTTTSGGCVIVSTQTITVTSTTYGNYTYSRNITLNNAAVGMSGNVSQFPVLLSIQNNDLIISGTCNDKILSPNGPNYDFAFFDSSTQSELYYQVESYNQTTGTLLVWVRIPTLYAATNNTLAFYYGAKVPSVTHNTAFTNLTWTADYQAVYHFNETAYTPTTIDGTANGRTASLSGFSAGSYVANGKIGSCYTFGGVQDMEAAATAPSSIITTSAWVNTSNNNSDEKVISDQNSSGNASGGYKLAVYYGSVELEAVYTGNRSSTTPAEPGLANNTWYYVTGVYDGTTMSTYVNGVQYKKLTVSNTSTFSNTLYIGIGEGKIYPFSGMIDEPRVSNIAKSSDWIKMEYADQNNPVAFTSVATNAASFSAANGASTPGEISYTWTGTTSTDPTVTSNWNNTATGTTALPPFDGTETLVIPTGLSKYPALTSAISAYGVNIAYGAQINLNGYILSVGCHIYNNAGGQILYGTSSTAGGITFNGSLATQYYYGTSSGIANIANLTVSNTAAGTVDITGGAVGINNAVTLTQGNLLVDNAGSGSLTLLSNYSNSGSVTAIPTGSSITGNVNVQRWISSGTGTRGYRLLTSPVNVSSLTSGSGAIGLSYINTSATFNGTAYNGGFTQGPGTGFTTNGSAHSLIYLYDESRPTDNSSFVSGKNIGVYSITGSSGSPAYSVTTQSVGTVTSGVNIPAANSYLYYFLGSNQSTVVASSLRTPDATTLTAVGYLNQGNIPFKFWKTGSTTMPYDVTTGTTYYGFSQVGNPYASTISLQALYNDNYNSVSNTIGASFYELIPGGNYVSYNAINGHTSDTRASQYIVSGQGFLAQATTTGETLTFMEDQKTAYSASSTLLESFPSGHGVTVDNLASRSKVHTDAFTKLAPVGTNPGANTGFHLQLTKDTADFAQTGIFFSSTGSDKYVSTEDAVALDGGTPVVFLSSYSSDSVKLSINTLADYGQGKRIRLYANAVATGTYNISLADIAEFDTANYNIYLVDKLQQDSLDLVHFKNYTFTINLADTTTFGANRFVLAVDHKAVGQYLLTTFNGQKVTTGVQLNWTAANAGNYTGYTLQKLNSTGGYDSIYSVQSDTSLSAYNFIDTHPVIGNNTYRLAQNGITGAITYSASVTVGYSSTTPNGTLTLYPNPASTIINVNLTSSSINVPTYIANIYNSAGVRVNQQTVTGSSWTSDVSSYKLGVYILQVKDTNGFVIGTAKFVKVQ